MPADIAYPSDNLPRAGRAPITARRRHPPGITYVPIGDARDDEQARPAESPQGAIVSAWRRRHARGDVIIVRRADDFIVGSSTRLMRSGSSSTLASGR